MDPVASRNIAERYSVRSYSDKTVPDDDIMAILDAAFRAPSSKNRQPWHYYIMKGEKKNRLVADMRSEVQATLESCTDEDLMKDLHGALNTAHIMDEAPILLIVSYHDRYEYPLNEKLNWSDMRTRELVDTLSIGASVENAILEATERGLGTLWIGDFLYAPETVSSIEGVNGHVVSMISVGYAKRSKGTERPREKLFDIL